MKTLKALMAALAVFAVMAVSISPAAAVTDGELDGERHPHVGLMVAQDAKGNPLWRCSGTMISPTIYLTAGHCTDGAAQVEIWFDADVESGIPDNGYPYDGPYQGTPSTHPQYDPNAFYLYDLGIVELKKPYSTPGDIYGTLPEQDELDVWETERGRERAWLTAVGYGLQESFPDAASWQENSQRVRMVAYPKLDQINTGFTGDFSLLLSNNANTGGTCFGDSGGPNFVRDTTKIAGVTSFGINGNCAGTGGVYRVDRADDLEFIYSFLNKR